MRRLQAKIGSCMSSWKVISTQTWQNSPCGIAVWRRSPESSNHAAVISAATRSPWRSPSASAWTTRPKLSWLYWRATSPGAPMATSSPRSSSIARSQKCSTDDMSWVTKMIVLPAALSVSNCSKHFCWKAASPTASTSSISRMSASTWIATAKPRRTAMPEE